MFFVFNKFNFLHHRNLDMKISIMYIAMIYDVNYSLDIIEKENKSL